MNTIHRRVIFMTIITLFIIAVFLVLLYTIINPGIFTGSPKVEIPAPGGFDATIIAAADIDYAPFSFIDENGEPSGFDVELLYAVANILHLNVDLRLMSWNECKDFVSSGKAHIITGNSYFQDEYSNIIQSMAIVNDPFVCIGREGFSNIGELSGKRLATIEKSGCIVDFLEPYKLLGNTTFYPTYTDVVISVIDGENDYALARYSVGNKILEKLDEPGVQIVGSILANSILCFGVNEHEPELAAHLDAAIDMLHRDGTIDALASKWLGHYVELIGFGSLFRIYSRELFTALAITLVAVSLFTFILYNSRLKIKRVQYESRMNKALVETEEYARLMLDSGPICCQLWSSDFRILDCNEAALTLYGYNTKAEYREKWLAECSPKYQPDGSRSDKKGLEYVKKAFEDGRCEFDWMHQMPDGTPIPSEVILVRIKYRNEHVVAGYTRDLRKVKELEAKAQMIYYDALTGIYSRRYLDENFPRLTKALSRSNSRLSVMMIDIDHFKQYNDTYGHDAGDKCLKAAATILDDNVARESDYIARYGGEEFVAVLPNTDERGAGLIAGKMLQSMRRANIPHASSSVAGFVTFSIGVATGTVKHPEDGEVLIKEADKMLYESKNNGRNRYTATTL